MSFAPGAMGLALKGIPLVSGDVPDAPGRIHFASRGISFAAGRKDFITLGEAGGKTWRTALHSQGLFRLPSEDAEVRGEDGSAQEEVFGKAGRNATADEWGEAREIAGKLGGDDAVKLLGESVKELSFPEQNDELVRVIGRAQSRLSRLHRWSWLIEAEVDKA